MAAVFHYSVLF